jgi:hypothetical protein
MWPHSRDANGNYTVHMPTVFTLISISRTWLDVIAYTHGLNWFFIKFIYDCGKQQLPGL